MWISSKEFAIKNGINKKSLEKACFRASLDNKKICTIKSIIIHFKYTQGKGRGGKTLQIWSKPLSKEEAQLVEQGFNIEDISCEFLDKAQSSKELGLDKTNIQALINTKAQNELLNKANTQNKKEVLIKALNDDVLLKNSKALQVQNTNKTKLSENQIQINKDSLSLFAKASSKKQNLALQKAAVIKEWLHAKGKISTNDFINYINAKKIYEFKLTQNKLFAWQKEYLANGLDALIDKRENKKDDAISTLGIKELFINTLLAQKGRLNASNIHRVLNYELAKNGKLDLKDFLGKKDEFISYECVLRSMKKYLKENKLIKNIILHGEDGAISRHLPALGVSNWKVNTINEIVEIDASPLDAICKVDFINETYGLKGDECSWHKRYTIISL
ncbi:integrase, partial [Campylobacter jejuni]|nr:integrase [Campylobacter jejuni]